MMKIISCLNLKLWLLIISVNLFSCENDKHVTEPGLEEGFFKLFFNLNDLNSNYYVSSIALIDTNNLILSTYGCIDTCSIYVIKNEKLISIDSSDFLMVDSSLNLLYSSSDYKLWKGENYIIRFYKHAKHCDYWRVSDLSNTHSSQIKIDKYGNIWEAKQYEPGLRVFDGNEWNSFFDSIVFMTI